MSEIDLDELLRGAAPRPTSDADDTALLLAREVRSESLGVTPLRSRHRSRLRTVVIVAVAGVVLSAAGTIGAYQLSIPPFQTLEDGVDRADTGIEVNYTNSLDREVECLAFIEYRNLDSEQRASIEQVSADDSWDGYGQRVLDQLAIPNSSPEVQNEAIDRVLGEDLWEAASTAVPGIVKMEDSDGPVFNGYSLSCANPGGVDGQE